MAMAKGFFEDKNVLVTGASGFLGGHLVEGLIGRKANVIGLVHDLKKNSYIKHQKLGDKITLVGSDILDLQRMIAVINKYDIDYIFHTAANAIVRSCSNDPIGCFQTNIMGTANVLEAARQYGRVQGIMCMESDKSYGSFDEKDLPYKETQAIKPRNVYEVSKASAGLVALSYYYNYNLPIFTIRAANLYGSGDMTLTRLVPGSILRILRNEQPILYSGVGNYIREFVYTKDASYFLIELMERIKETKGNVINVGSGQTFSVKDVMEKICGLMKTKQKPKIVEKEDTFKEIEKQYLDLKKLKKLLGSSFRITDFDKGLKETIDWYTKFHKES